MQDNINELSLAIKELSKTMHNFQLEFIAVSTKRDMQIDLLQKSDEKQWDIIRKQQFSMIRILYGIAGGLTVLLIFDIPAKLMSFIRDLMSR